MCTALEKQWVQIRIWDIQRASNNSVRDSTRHSHNVGTMLAQRRRRWPNIVPTLGERLVSAGY